MAFLEDENLYQTANYAMFDSKITFDLKEGDIKCKKAYTAFGREDSWDVLDGLEKGDFVELVPNKRMMVQKATGEKPIIGEIIDQPEFGRGSRFPKKETASFGEYTPRVATVYTYATFVHEMPLVTENAEIKAGDYLVFDADEQAFDKSSTETGLIALEPKGALETGKIATMMGGFGGIV